MQSFLEVLNLSWVGPILFIFGPLSPELLLKFENNYFTGLLSSLSSVSVPFPEGPLQRLRSLKTSIGVKAYCLPEDETIGEFGFLSQLF